MRGGGAKRRRRIGPSNEPWAWRVYSSASARSSSAITCALNERCMPPTINDTPDPEIDLHIVGNTAEPVDSRYAIVNAFGFGGQNVVAVFGKVGN